MIHYERWMSLPTIALGILAIVAFAIARQTPPSRYADTWLRVGTLAAAIVLCYLGFVYGLTDHRKVRHWPILARVMAAALSVAGLILLWQAITRTGEELRRTIFRAPEGDGALLARRAMIDATVQKTDKWRVILAVVGIFVIAVALAVVGHAPKTEPPATEEHLGWLLFLCGLGATIPLFISLAGALKKVRSHAKGI